MTTKTCSGPCGRTLPLDAFRLVKANKDGLAGVCRSCQANKQRDYYQRNRERITQKYKAPTRGLGGPYLA